MLSTNVTQYDVIFIAALLISITCLYVGYRWGHANGEKAGKKAQRQVDRSIRRGVYSRK